MPIGIILQKHRNINQVIGKTSWPDGSLGLPKTSLTRLTRLGAVAGAGPSCFAN
jgi:hypothetical protein